MYVLIIYIFKNLTEQEFKWPYIDIADHVLSEGIKNFKQMKEANMF